MPEAKAKSKANDVLDYTFAPGTEDSPEFQAVMAWLVAQGAPSTWKVKFYKLHPVPGEPERYTAQIIWSKNKFDDYESDAGLTLLRPSVTLVEIAKHFKIGGVDLNHPPLYGYILEVPEALPKPASVPEPADPVGPDFAPNRWYMSAGCTLPHGKLYIAQEDEPCRNLKRGQILKLVRQQTPWGDRCFWERY